MGVSCAVITSAYGRQSQGTVRLHLLDLPVSQYGVDMADHTDDLRLAHILADDADSLTMSRFGARDLTVSTKPDHSEVTDADLAVEDSVRRTLSRMRSRDIMDTCTRPSVLGVTSSNSTKQPKSVTFVTDPA